MYYQALIQTIADVINFKVYLRSSSKSVAGRKKEGKTEIEKFEYLKNEKIFLDKRKSIFHNYLWAAIW